MLMQHEVVRSFRDWHGPWRKVPKGKIQYEGERPKPLPHPKVCTLVCTLAYSNPVYGQKIVLGISGRIPCSTLRIAKIGACALGSQSRRAQRVAQDHRADNNRTCIGRALGRILNRKALYGRSPLRSQRFRSVCIPFASVLRVRSAQTRAFTQTAVDFLSCVALLSGGGVRMGPPVLL